MAYSVNAITAKAVAASRMNPAGISAGSHCLFMETATGTARLGGVRPCGPNRLALVQVLRRLLQTEFCGSNHSRSTN